MGHTTKVDPRDGVRWLNFPEVFGVRFKGIWLSRCSSLSFFVLGFNLIDCEKALIILSPISWSWSGGFNMFAKNWEANEVGWKKERHKQRINQYKESHIAILIFRVRGHSTTTWTEVCYLMTPPHLVHIVIEFSIFS